MIGSCRPREGVRRPLRYLAYRLGLDEKQVAELNSTTRTTQNITPANCDFVEIGFGELNISKWAMDYCRMQPCSVRALGDTAIGVPELTRICHERIAKDAFRAIESRLQRHDSLPKYDVLIRPQPV